MRVLFQYPKFGPGGEDDPFRPGAYILRELPYPPLVGHYVSVPFDKNAPQTEDLEVQTIAWYLDEDPLRDHDVLVILK